MSWCEIFKAGQHVDKHGRIREWTVADLDRMANNYDPINFHEAPIVIDHSEESGPVTGGPAYGWVQSLKRVGDRLYAQFRQVVPEFAELVNKGMFKKRSVRVRPDGTLMHVSFLGAAAPAIKGLKDFTFSQGEIEDSFCYSEDVGRINQINEEELQNMDEIARLKAALDESEKEKSTLRADLDQANSRLESKDHEFSEFRGTALRNELKAEFDAAVKEGRALPAWEDAGILDFMANLNNDAQDFEFSEGQKNTQLGWFRSFLKSLGEHKLFGEIAKKGKAVDVASDFSEANDKLVEMMVSAGNGGK